MIEYITVKTKKRTDLIDITSDIQKIITSKGVKSGVCYIHTPHTTAGVTINEGADPSVRHDILDALNRLIPKDPHYKHLEGNSDAHIKSSLIGVSITVLIDEGKLLLGTWQTVYFCEFDGPRHRRVVVKIV